jgi:hypothetical protein
LVYTTSRFSTAEIAKTTLPSPMTCKFCEIPFSPDELRQEFVHGKLGQHGWFEVRGWPRRARGPDQSAVSRSRVFHRNHQKLEIKTIDPLASPKPVRLRAQITEAIFAFALLLVVGAEGRGSN